MTAAGDGFVVEEMKYLSSEITQFPQEMLAILSTNTV